MRDRVYRERRGRKRKTGRRCPSTAAADSRRKEGSVSPSFLPLPLRTFFLGHPKEFQSNPSEGSKGK